MSKTRRNHGSAFKAKVALEVLKGELTEAEISAKHGLHPTLVNKWKRQLADGAPSSIIPSFHMIEKVFENILFCCIVSAKRSMSGSRRLSGMVGIRSYNIQP